jgi:sec-independent protein translocase protein TatB
MFDLGWWEVVVIGVAALIFIGPKELPGALRTAGKFVSKARQMAREFQGNVEEMVRESELDEIKKQVDKVATGDLTRSIESQIDPKGEISSAFSPPTLPSLDTPSPLPPSLDAPSPSPPPTLPPPAAEPAPSPPRPS